MNAAVGVDDQLARGHAPSGGHAERVEHERGRLGAVDRPADDHARERVQHDAAVELAFARRVLGDVGHPQLVQARAAELPRDQIERRDLPDAGPLGEPPGRQAFDAELAHDRLDGVVADDDLAAVSQLRGDAQRAVGAGRGLVDIGDLAGQPDPAQRTRRERPRLPVVVARLRHAEHPAGVADVDPLPGQRLNHREEPFGAGADRGRPH